MNRFLFTTAIALALCGPAAAEVVSNSPDRTMTDAQFDAKWNTTTDGYFARMIHEIIPLECKRVEATDRMKDTIHCAHTFMYLLDTYTLENDKPMYSHDPERWYYQICEDHNYCFSKTKFN
jgi:hypothetical protein